MVTDRIRVASVMSLGWIPFHKHLSDLPPCEYHSYASQSYKARIGCDLLFYSGNDRPSYNVFEHVEKFMEHIKSKDYRGALMLYDIELDCFDNGNHKVHFKTLPPQEQIGYTPIRWPFPRSKVVLHYSKGRGKDNSPSIRYTHDGVIVSYEVAFRIGRLGNLGVKVLTHYWAPFVWFRLDMHVKRTGAATVELSGSFIPNQMHFALEPSDLAVPLYYHDMESNDLDQIMTVLEYEGDKAEGNYFRRTTVETLRL
jgi:hypothetical protein